MSFRVRQFPSKSCGTARRRDLEIARVLLLTASFACLLAPHVASAATVTVAPGDTVYSVGDSFPTTGVVIAGGTQEPYSFGSISGYLTSSVIAGDTDNPYGGLTFTYLLESSLASTSQLHRLTINDFGGWLTDFSYQLPAVGINPITFDRGFGSGDVVGFTWLGAPVGYGAINPGGSGSLLVIQTNAPSYQATTASVIDGVTASVNSLAPAVPEPSTMALLALGAIALSACGLRSFGRPRI